MSVSQIVSHAVSLLIAIAVVAGAVAFVPKVNQWATEYQAWANPVLKDFVAVNWRQDPATGFWSVRVFGDKADGGCEFVKGQQVVAQAIEAPHYIPSEVLVVFINDDTPDSNRPAGYQDYGRWEFQKKGILPGATVQPAVAHDCPHRSENRSVLTKIRPPSVVGVDGVMKGLGG